MLEAARDLYAVAPEGFIAARNQLVKQLKTDGHADDAATVAKLRRPRLAEWALNRLAHSRVESVDRFAHATAAAQRAQSAAIGGDPTALRAATAELRDALNAVADAAVAVLAEEGGNGEGQRDDVTAILRQLVATADPSPLVVGVVGSEAIVSTGDFFPGAPDPVSRPTRPKATEQPEPRPTTAQQSLERALAESPGTPEPVRRGPTTPGKLPKQTVAAVRAMQRAERLGLRQRTDATRAEVHVAEAAVEHAQAALVERRTALKVAQAAARAAEEALAAFDTANSSHDETG